MKISIERECVELEDVEVGEVFEAVESITGEYYIKTDRKENKRIFVVEVLTGEVLLLPPKTRVVEVSSECSIERRL